MENRREVVAGLGGLAGVMLGGAASAKPKGAGRGPAHGDAALSNLLDRFVSHHLDKSPETVTALGLDKGARAGQRSRLSDASWAAAVADNADKARFLAEVKAFDTRGLSESSRTLHDAVAYALQLGVDGGRFAFGDNSFSAAMNEGATPYVVNQQSGAVSSIPEFLNSQHQINDRADCESYLARLAAFPGVIDAETARVRRDTALGVIAPDFILDTTLEILDGFVKTPAASSGMVRSVEERAKAKGIAGDWAGRATKIVQSGVYPAVARQLAVLRAARARANHDAGVWKLPHGEAYYSWFLRVGTSTTLSAAEIHKMGLEQKAQIEARMDAILKSQGLTQGSVGARTQALTKDPRFLYPNTDAGRAQILEYLNGRIAAVRGFMPKLSKLDLKAPVIVKRVPPDIEKGAGQGYMNFGSLDGSRPAIYYINLADTANWPRWTLPSLTTHETIPGHAWQGAYLAEMKAPLIDSLMGFNAYIEGWALYAEQLADESGYYDDDPFGRLGYLQGQQFRACRLVVDTGLHAQKWGREQAIDWLVENTGRARGGMQSEVDRYVAGPGQACGYKVGHTELLRLREKARTALGPKFDLRDYNDAVVEAGGVPLTVLETVIDRYIAAKRT